MRRSPEGIIRERERVRVNAFTNYWSAREEGKCYRCGEKTELNFKTNKPYHMCIKHRRIEYKRQRERRNENIQ